MPLASWRAILECLKQKSPVDDKIKGRHGNRDFFYFPEMWPPWGKKHKGKTKEGNGGDEERVGVRQRGKARWRERE